MFCWGCLFWFCFPRAALYRPRRFFVSCFGFLLFWRFLGQNRNEISSFSLVVSCSFLFGMTRGGEAIDMSAYPWFSGSNCQLKINQ